MRLPRKVTISGRDFIVCRDSKKSTGCGSGRFDTGVITVGSNGDPEQAIETYVHEVMEIAMLQNDLRYNRDGTNEFMYQMTHTEFSRYSEDVIRALRPMIKC